MVEEMDVETKTLITLESDFGHLPIRLSSS